MPCLPTVRKQKTCSQLRFVSVSHVVRGCLSHLSDRLQVKLDPSRIDAWNSLGNCFWKKKDLTAAMNCFTGAAKQVGRPVPVNKGTTRMTFRFRVRCQTRCLSDSCRC